jgi:hypothetical protein
MYFIQFNLIITIILSIITIIYYISKVKEFTLNYLNYIIPIVIFALFLDFLINFTRYVPSELPSQPYNTVMVFISQFLLFISAGIYIISITYSDEDIINLEYPSRIRARKGKIYVGKIMNQNVKKHKFNLSLDDLEKHVFICGATGMGKSNFVQNFLINFKKNYEIPFLLIEFKAEYIFLQNIIEDVLVFRPGENFSINIFDPEGAHPEIHAERIFDILKSGQFLDETAEYSPQMQKALVDVLTEVCKNKSLQNWEGFYKQCGIYLKEERNKVPMLAQTLISIRNRIRRFSIGPLKAIFGTKTEFKIKELFKRNIIIDLSSIIRLGGEKEDALFFLNMILKYLWDENLTKGSRGYKGIKHLTVVEDAQYFAPKDITNQTKLSTYLEDIALLQRGTGECLISVATRPQVSEEILANCGVLVIFKNHMEKEFQCELLNLEEMDEHYLSILEKGRCLIRVNSFKRPFLLWNPYIPRETLTNFEINENNERILNKNKAEKEIPLNVNKKEEPKAEEKMLKKPPILKNKTELPKKEINKKPELIEHEKILSNFNINDSTTESGNESSELKEFEKFINKLVVKEKKLEEI